MVTLDRCLMTSAWEDKFPLCSAWIVLDHSPMVLDAGEDNISRERYFFYENQWSLDPDFIPLVQQKWLQGCGRHLENCNVLDAWHGGLCFLRRFSKGWNIKRSREQKKEKKERLELLTQIDSQAEVRDLTPQEWKHRYDIEAKVEQIYQREELYWQ